MPTVDDALVRFRSFYDEFSAAWIDRIEELYAPGFVFRDSFHTIEGDFDAMRAYFRRVLTALHSTRFVVEDVATGGDGSYVRWRWEWQRRARDSLRTVPGVTTVLAIVVSFASAFRPEPKATSSPDRRHH